VKDAYITDGHTFSYRVEIDLDMLRALVLNEVGGEVDNADIVTGWCSSTVKRGALMLYGDSQKMMEGPEIRHSKF
jgi:hypothetical protein